MVLADPAQGGAVLSAALHLLAVLLSAFLGLRDRDRLVAKEVRLRCGLSSWASSTA